MGILDKIFGPATKDKFAKLVMDGVRRAGETRKLDYDRQQFRLRPLGEPWPIMNLGNMYDEFCSAAAEAREQVVRTAVRNWFADRKELPALFEDVHPDLLPSVRSRSYGEFTLLQLEVAGAVEANWPQHIIGDHLAVGLVYDMPDSMRLIQQGDLDDWGVTFYEALEAARDNLKQMPEQVFLSPRDGVYVSATGDNYDASRMVLLDVIRQLPVQGDYVAMIPNRDTLLITGSEDDEGLTVMATFAERALQQPRPITAIAFRLDGDDWTTWLPETDQPPYKLLKLLQVQSLGQEYGEQKELLDQLNERTGDPAYVAQFSGIEEKATGEIFSYCVWPEGIEALLPRTDRLLFFRGKNESKDGTIVAAGQWEQVAEIVGDMLQPMYDRYPERFRVREFPSREQLKAIGKTI
jgi:hypothetical protein